MVNLKHRLTVDDLIVEYMIYKVHNGYEPKFTSTEFLDFLYFFTNKMPVEDVLYNNDLFSNFFVRKIISDWYQINPNTKVKEPKPHMDMKYSEDDDDYVIFANYRLSGYDESVINTYFMDNGMRKEDGPVSKIRSIIGDFLSNQPKRFIDEEMDVSDEEMMVGKYLAAEIILQIWDCYVEKHVENRSWPSQCRDIQKFLFECDLSKIIGLDSIKDKLLELYRVLSKRIAVMYHLDRDLKVSSNRSSYLARANYDLLVQEFENIMDIAFNHYNKSMEFDLSTLTFKESHEEDGIYGFYDDSDIKTTVSSIGNNKVKQIVKYIDNNN